MKREQSITEVLGQAIQALAALDLNKLEHLEKQTAALADIGSAYRDDDPRALLAKQRLLSMLLQNCRSNLDALSRLRGRNMRDQWAH